MVMERKFGVLSGKDGYWEERAKGEWTGVTEVFQA
jgi:hypothetical protein